MKGVFGMQRRLSRWLQIFGICAAVAGVVLIACVLPSWIWVLLLGMALIGVGVACMCGTH